MSPIKSPAMTEIEKIVEEIRLVVESQRKPLAFDQWLSGIAARVEKLKSLAAPRVNVGRDFVLNLPDDCKVLKDGDRLLIEAPSPKSISLRRKKIARAIWLVMQTPKECLEADSDWEETDEGRAAFHYANAAIGAMKISKLRRESEGS